MQIDAKQISNWQNMPPSEQQALVADVVDLINRLLVAQYKTGIETSSITADPVLNNQLQIALGAV